MNAQQMWDAYCEQAGVTAEYEAWAFGDDPDELARLVLEGKKTGTSSLHLWYGLEGEKLPEAGEYSVILDSRENPVCVTRTTRVYVVPYGEVSQEHAYREGEGDRSLAYWRQVHERFFSEELRQIGMAFSPEMNVVCEEFMRVYP